MGNTIYQIAFLCAELPSQMISKVSPVTVSEWSLWLSGQANRSSYLDPEYLRWMVHSVRRSVLVGAQPVRAAQTDKIRLSGRSSFYATRALLGLLQGGFIPDLVLYLVSSRLRD